MLSAQPSAKLLSLIEAAMRAGALATPEMGLFTGNPALSVGTVLADLAALEPTFAGYARETMTLGALRRNTAGDYIDPFASVTFQPTAAVSPAQTVTGIFVVATISAVDYLLYSEYLTTPFTFNGATDALDVMFDAYWKNITAYGGICATC